MDQPVLVVMAAGMGRRYGGLKQMDPMDEAGHVIMDFSLFDARRAGFEKVIFIIRRAHERAFREAVGDRLSKDLDVAYAFQELTDLPAGFSVPEGRVKPWGTAHAIYSCRQLLSGPFAVINADDYYGPAAFRLIYDYLCTHPDDTKYRYAMVGYELGKTVTEHGSVSRGVCRLTSSGELAGIEEHTQIELKDGGIAYTEDDGATWVPIPGSATVSMNMWGFTLSFLQEIQAGFPAFLNRGLADAPLTCEYFLPDVVGTLLGEEKAGVAVLPTADTWYGVTYQEDKPVLVQAIRDMKEAGLYPAHLWSGE